MVSELDWERLWFGFRTAHTSTHSVGLGGWFFRSEVWIDQFTGGEVQHLSENSKMFLVDWFYGVLASLGLFGNKTQRERQSVWMSHGDEVVKLPEGFEVVARSKQGAVAGVKNVGRRFFGLHESIEFCTELGIGLFDWIHLIHAIFFIGL